MKFTRPTLLAMALAAAFPVCAQSNADLMREMQELRNRVTELEKKLQEAQAKAAPAAGAPAGQWGMTPEQAAEFNRIAVKTEAMQDELEQGGFKGLKISGYMDPTYIWNQRQDRAGFQFLNSQDDGYFYDTSYMGTVSLSLVKEMEGGTIWELTLNPRGPGALVGAGIVEKAIVSVPLTDLQTRFIAGQMPDWSGYEYMQPTLNPLITHNLLFDFTLPSAYTGAGVDLTIDKWWLRAMIANVNGTIMNAGETAPALVFRGDYARGEFSGWGFAGLFGKTTNYNLCADADCNSYEKTMTSTFEVDGWYTRGDITLGGQVSVGMQDQASIIPGADGNWRDAKWWGLSGLVGYNFTPRLQGLVRADYINNAKNGGGLFGYTGYSSFDDGGALVPGNDDRNGIGPDLNGNLDDGANRFALSLGLKYVYNLNTTFKVEYRYDGADQAVFYDVDSGTYKKNNSLLGASVVVAF